MTTSPDRSTPLQALAESTQRMIRTVDGLDADALVGPSLLPGWTRAHVVAHLALNGEGLAGAVEGVTRGDVVPMYASSEQRDADIEELAVADPAELRTRLLASGTALDDALRELPDDRRDVAIPRTPGGPTFPAGVVHELRRREVEIHHADLDAGYGHRSWPVDFVTGLLDRVAADRADSGPFTVRAVDLDRTWPVGGDGGPTVSGTGADLGWWMCGRGQAAGLSVDDGALPELGRWR